MQVILREHEWCNGEAREVRKLEVYPGVVNLHTASVVLSYPYDLGSLVVEVVHYVGKVLTVQANDELMLRIDGSLVVDSWSDGRLSLTCSRHGLFQVKAGELIIEESDRT
jgi:hypothetical protein